MDDLDHYACVYQSSASAPAPTPAPAPACMPYLYTEKPFFLPPNGAKYFRFVSLQNLPSKIYLLHAQNNSTHLDVRL